MTSHPVACRILRMMFIAASCPSKRLAAVTMRTLWLGLYGSGAVWPARRDEGVSFLAARKISELMNRYRYISFKSTELKGGGKTNGPRYGFVREASRTALNSDPSFHCGHEDSEARRRPTSNSNRRSSNAPSRCHVVASYSSACW